MAAEKSVILVTGGNSGIGFEVAAQLIADPTNHVIIGSRSVEKGSAVVKKLQSRSLPGDVEMLHLDVTSLELIEAAAKKVERKHGRLDVLVNNAGIAARPPMMPLDKAMRVSFETNCVGPAMMVEAFSALLEKSTTTARIVNVTSSLGSITLRLDSSSGLYGVQSDHYRGSKAYLNMLTACQAVEYGPKGIKVFAVCPGFTVSNLGPENVQDYGAQPTADGAKPIVDIVNGRRDEEHAGFLHAGGQYPW